MHLKQRFLAVVSDSSSLLIDSCEECEPSTSSEPEAREKRVVSLLDLLRPPDSSNLSRKRKVIVNKGGQVGNRRSVSSNEKPNYEPQVLAKKRLEESIKESFKVVSDTVLFCQACKNKSLLRNRIIKGHIRSKKHSANKEILSKTKEKGPC